MNEQELKSMIENILTDMTSKDSQTSAKTNLSNNDNADTTNNDNKDLGEVLDDITQIDLKKQFLVPHPHDKEGY